MFLLISVLYFLLFILILILLVAYFTLLERKIISAVQRRKGPDYTGFFGVLQPIADALKLLLKNFIIPKVSYIFLFIIIPVIVLFLSLLIWFFIPLSLEGSISFSEISLLWILAISSLNVYILFLAGWSSNSRYALIGSLRSIAQFLSYELAISILVLPIIFVTGSLDINSIFFFQNYANIWNFVWMFPNAIIFYICLLAETNRAPFDMPEAEAELVAGYNVEYSSLPFAFFFLGEYLNIFTMSVIYSILFMGGISKYFIFFIFKVLFLVFSIIWVRATLPRVRYDFLMSFFWKYSLLFSFSYFVFFVTMYSLMLFFF